MTIGFCFVPTSLLSPLGKTFLTNSEGSNKVNYLFLLKDLLLNFISSFIDNYLVSFWSSKTD